MAEPSELMQAAMDSMLKSASTAAQVQLAAMQRLQDIEKSIADSLSKQADFERQLKVYQDQYTANYNLD